MGREKDNNTKHEITGRAKYHSSISRESRQTLRLLDLLLAKRIVDIDLEGIEKTGENASIILLDMYFNIQLKILLPSMH